MRGDVVAYECVGVRFLFFVVCSLIDEGGRCLFDRGLLLRILGCSRSSLWRWMRRLEDLGVVSVEGDCLVVSVCDVPDWGSVISVIRDARSGACE